MRTSDYEACREPFEIPFPWSRESLIEIVNVENDPALRRGESSKIHQVAVSAGLHVESCERRVSQILRHNRRSAAEKRKWRLKHPSVPDRQELLHPSLA